MVIRNAPIEDSDQTERMRRLIRLCWAQKSKGTFSDVASPLIVFMSCNDVVSHLASDMFSSNSCRLTTLCNNVRNAQ